jgi:hypothetical protein
MSRFTTLVVAAASALALGTTAAPLALTTAPAVAAAGTVAKVVPGGGNWCC